MRRIVIAFGLSAIVALVANSSAAAADMPVKAYGPVARAYDWTGFYLGADVGGARSNASWTLIADQTTFADFPPGGPGSWVTSHRLSGWVGGGHLGYQKQYGHVVLGAELSLLALSLAGNAPSVQEAMDDQYSTEVNDLILADARIGYAWNNNLLTYLRGGLASASVKTRIVDAVGTSTGIWESKERHNGWNIGAGVEFGWTRNVIIGVQYDYIDLGEKTHSALGISGGGTSQLWAGNINAGPISMVTARVSYKFGGPY